MLIADLAGRPLRGSALRCLGPWLAALIIGISACSTSPQLYLRQELANQGPVGLSPKNPYIAGNLFVAREMEHSNVFDGFIRNRGTPDAVEVKQGYLRPLRVYLFYLNEGEAYLFEESSGDWLVRGPEKIPSQMMRSFLNIQPTNGAAPLAIQGAPEPAVGAEEAPAANVRSLRQVPTRAEAVRRRPEAGSQRPAPPPASRPPVVSTPPTDEESSSGDVIHRVTYPGETLRNIAQWYTGDINNTGRIARINGIEKPDKLSVNQTIRIPRYLLRTAEPMPASAVGPASEVAPAPPSIGTTRPPVRRPRSVYMEDAPPPGGS